MRPSFSLREDGNHTVIWTQADGRTSKWDNVDGITAMELAAELLPGKGKPLPPGALRRNDALGITIDYRGLKPKTRRRTVAIEIRRNAHSHRRAVIEGSRRGWVKLIGLDDEEPYRKSVERTPAKLLPRAYLKPTPKPEPIAAPLPAPPPAQTEPKPAAPPLPMSGVRSADIPEAPGIQTPQWQKGRRGALGRILGFFLGR
ncbi:hypothetical protein ACEUZ9_000951 [Paracoccus litorisediminis]|uniref:hypothetical protein n=1 Tax=Paracoccus litorisediminis TaxID=2006130 RepID=UPI0037345ADC